MRVSSRFINADLTVERTETQQTYRGEEQTGASTVLTGRCYFQESGRTLQRKRDVYEAVTALVFYEGDLTAIEPGDRVTIDHDDGRSLEGAVEKIEPPNLLLLSL